MFEWLSRRFASPELLGFLADPLDYLVKRHRDDGEIVDLHFGRKNLFSIRDPVLARKILKETHVHFVKNSRFRRGLDTGILASEPPLWDQQHALVAKLFSSGFLDRLRATTKDEITPAVDRWIATVKPLDLEQEFLRITFHIITQAMFGFRCSDDVFCATQHAITVASRSLQRLWLSPVPLPAWMPTPENCRLRDSLAVVDAFCRDVYDRAKISDEDSPLRLLIAGSSRSQAIAEIKSLLIAGHETVAQALTWTCALLARHQAWQARLRTLSRSPDDRFESLAKDVFREVLRLYPPQWLIVRQTTGAFSLGSRDIPNNSSILISLYAIHRHPSFWNEPDVFDPNRFVVGNAGRSPAYLPFGFGPRMCLGSATAQEQAIVVLKAMVNKSQLASVDDTLPRPHPSATLRTHEGFFATFTSTSLP
jgi:cytochrome P450